VVEEVDLIDDDALLRGGLTLQQLVALDDTCVLLNDLVARAGRHIITVGPNRGAWIIRKERAQEFVSIVRAQRIRSRADRVTHGIRSLRTRFSARRPTLTALRRRTRRRRRARRR